MQRRKTRGHRDRYIVLKDHNYHYKRRVPQQVAHLDSRAPMIRFSLKTSNLELAWKKRDEYEKADDAYWASLLTGDNRHLRQYEAATMRAEAHGFRYKSAPTIAQDEVTEIASRMEEIILSSSPKPKVKALLGLDKDPGVTVSQAFQIYCEKIAVFKLAKKSPTQKRNWKKGKQRAVNNFITLCGNKPMNKITRDDGLLFEEFWAKRVMPPEGTGWKARDPNSANRDITNMRVLYKEFFKRIGDRDRPNPFRDIHFDEDKKVRPPFSTDWIENKLLMPGALARMNDEARAILFTVLETGARPSEICNLIPSKIRLQHNIPHIAITARTDPDDPREVKSKNSERELPLVGVALAAMRKHPNGFPRYKDKEEGLSKTINKFLRENGLLETEDHSFYSLRHSIETRMKLAKVGEDVRRAIMGHNVPDREEYGIDPLEWMLGGLKAIELPFDPSIV
jgi:integrase